jgi:hypothetical protein
MKNQPFRIVASNIEASDVTFALTIAVPTFKRPALLEETLRSIAALEFVATVEVIVVDNDPEGDDTRAAELIAHVITGPYRYYRNEENVGMFRNWNQCLLQARGNYITILHDDDLLSAQFSTAVDQLLTHGRLEHDIVGFQINLLEQRPDRLHDQAVRATPAAPPEDMSMRLFPVSDLFFSNPFCGTLAVIFHREKAIELGGFRAEWYPIADYEFWCRWAARYGAIPIANWRVAQYRIGQNESMKLETRAAFVTKSRELRQHLIVSSAVPGVFATLVGVVEMAQRSQIYRDWRAADEPHPSAIKNAAMSICGKALRVAAKATRMLGRDRRHTVEPT